MPLRHRWFKLKTHQYICRVCGCRKTNVEARGGYVAEWSTADGVRLQGLTPQCVIGIETERRLVWLAEFVLDHPSPAPAVATS